MDRLKRYIHKESLNFEVRSRLWDADFNLGALMKSIKWLENFVKSVGIEQ